MHMDMHALHDQLVMGGVRGRWVTCLEGVCSARFEILAWLD